MDLFEGYACPSLTKLFTSLLLAIGLLTLFYKTIEEDVIYQDPLPKKRLTETRNEATYRKSLQKTHQVTNIVPTRKTLKGNLKCAPSQRIVFLKTHKTGSTTTASIFERYGYYRGLKFAVGPSHILSRSELFQRSDILKFPHMNGTFNILCNHARYNREEMNAVIPNAIYITIIRKPEDQLESAFAYFKMYKEMNIPEDKNAFKTFMNDPMKYYKGHNYKRWQGSRNGQLFDLGFDHKNDDDETRIAAKVAEIDRDFDLVMLTEHYDESLILLKRLLCWDYEDILYFPLATRSDSKRMTKDKDSLYKARKWNHGDVLLYDFFTKVFWKKVVEYGPLFGEHLQKFRKLKQDVTDECFSHNQTNKKNSRVSDRCQRLRTGDVALTRLIKDSMLNRYSK